MQSAFVYDLDFVSRTKSLSRKPEIAVLMSKATYEEVLPHLIHVGDAARGEIREYFGGVNRPFFKGDKVYLGYKRCCRVESQNGEVQLYFDLRVDHLREIVVTLVLLTLVLRGRFKLTDSKPGQVRQLLEIGTHINQSQHGHGVEGRSFPSFGRWLKKQAHEGAHAMRRVEDAMMEAWQAVAPLNVRRQADTCTCFFANDGRFVLKCNGDSSDLSMHPDGVVMDIGKYTAPINSHNVESPHVQITLIAGLVAMCGLARADQKK